MSGALRRSSSPTCRRARVHREPLSDEIPARLADQAGQVERDVEAADAALGPGLGARLAKPGPPSARGRHRAALRTEVVATLDDPSEAEVDDEIRALFVALGRSPDENSRAAGRVGSGIPYI
jgi:hypothetical protein